MRGFWNKIDASNCVRFRLILSSLNNAQIASLGDWRFLFRDLVSSAQTQLKYDTLRAEKVNSSNVP